MRCAERSPLQTLQGIHVALPHHPEQTIRLAQVWSHPDEAQHFLHAEGLNDSSLIV